MGTGWSSRVRFPAIKYLFFLFTTTSRQIHIQLIREAKRPKLWIWQTSFHNPYAFTVWSFENGASCLKPGKGDMGFKAYILKYGKWHGLQGLKQLIANATVELCVITDYKHVHNFRVKGVEKPNYVADVNLWSNLYKILEIFMNFWNNDFYHIWSVTVFTD